MGSWLWSGVPLQYLNSPRPWSVISNLHQHSKRLPSPARISLAKVQCTATGCDAKFSPDGHDRCMVHSKCFEESFVFAPDDCSICRFHTEVLQHQPSVDRDSFKFGVIAARWKAVRKLASTHKEKASWKDPSLHNLLGFPAPWQDWSASVLSPTLPQRCPMDPLGLVDEPRDIED